MQFFDKIGDKLSKTGQSALKKTKGVAESVKLNSMITDEERKITNLFLELGKLCYQNHWGSEDPVATGLISQINGAKANVVNLTNQINQLKGVVICDKCSAEVENDKLFCGQCGAPVVREQPAVVEETVEQVPADSAPEQSGEEDSVQCNGCGAMLAVGAAFCTHCGYRLNVEGDV